MGKLGPLTFYLPLAACLVSCKAARIEADDTIVTQWIWWSSALLTLVALAAAPAGVQMLRAAFAPSSRKSRIMRRGSSGFLRSYAAKVGLVLLLGCPILLAFAWKDFGVYQKISPHGVEMRVEGELRKFAWTDFIRTGGRINSTSFGLLFERDGKKGAVRFDEEEVGAEIQDKAIALIFASLRAHGIQLVDEYGYPAYMGKP